MVITEQMLAERKQGLQGELEAAQAEQVSLTGRLNAIYGAIQDCDYWLAKVKEEPRPEGT